MNTNEHCVGAPDVCTGVRYLGCGLKTGSLVLHGTPGNALGAYLDGGNIELFGNAQDATGDTMNGGEIVIHGSCGDAAGYAMRGGEIYIECNVGYRAGVHIKAYGDVSPSIVIGGVAGSFLGEYQAGGTIIVLNLEKSESAVGAFTAAGMYGGRIFVRSKSVPEGLPEQVEARRADPNDMADIKTYIKRFCAVFGKSIEDIYSSDFYLLTPDSANPYKRMYVSV